MIQRQFTDAELDVLAKAVARLQHAHNQAKERSTQFGVDHCYVIHTYGHNSRGERVDSYSAASTYYHPGVGLTSEVVAKYSRGQEVSI